MLKIEDGKIQYGELTATTPIVYPIVSRGGFLKAAEVCIGDTAYFMAGTTGYCGGDSGHGGKTHIEIAMPSSYDFQCDCSEGGSGYKKVVISAGGDWELDTIVEGLKFILNTLTDQIDDSLQHEENGSSQ